MRLMFMIILGFANFQAFAAASVIESVIVSARKIVSTSTHPIVSVAKLSYTPQAFYQTTHQPYIYTLNTGTYKSCRVKPAAWEPKLKQFQTQLIKLKHGTELFLIGSRIEMTLDIINRCLQQGTQQSTICTIAIQKLHTLQYQWRHTISILTDTEIGKSYDALMTAYNNEVARVSLPLWSKGQEAETIEQYSTSPTSIDEEIEAEERADGINWSIPIGLPIPTFYY